jgi:O-antigen ligase
MRSRRLLLLGIVVLALYMVINTAVLDSWFADESVSSGDTRLAAWNMNWKFTKDHLLFGMGPAGYAVYYMTYNPLDAMATHNNYIDLISQTGIVGSAFYLTMFGLLLWRGWVVYNRVKGRRDYTEALIVAALAGTCGCLVIMAFGDWLLPFAYTQTIEGFNYSVYSWLFMGLIVALDQITDQEKKLESKTHA